MYVPTSRYARFRNIESSITTFSLALSFFVLCPRSLAYNSQGFRSIWKGENRCPKTKITIAHA
jgi:hypothetical protein